jgi:hypothetical protein
MPVRQALEVVLESVLSPRQQSHDDEILVAIGYELPRIGREADLLPENVLVCRHFPRIPTWLRKFFNRHAVDALTDGYLDMLAVADIPTDNAGSIFPAHPITVTIRRGHRGWRGCRASAALAGLARFTAG